MILLSPNGQRYDLKIPNLLNLGVTLFSVSGALFMIVMANHYYQSGNILLFLLFAVLFSFLNNTNFGLLHEAVHRVYHSNVKVNDWGGRVLAAMFPTGFLFQRLCHLGHHCRNRTDVEMFELYYPKHDNRLLKKIQLYCVLTGVYWTNPPTGCLLYTFFPWLLKMDFLRSKKSHKVQTLSADAMLSSVEKGNPTVIRLEILFSILFQAVFIYFFEISFVAWIACYWAFGVNWGSLQYADHAWTKRDIRNGAWNLKVHPLLEWIFLKYHHHLAHHQYPQVPWIYLDRFLDPNYPQVSFWKIYFRLWKGPTPTEELPPRAIDPEFESLIFNPAPVSDPKI